MSKIYQRLRGTDYDLTHPCAMYLGSKDPFSAQIYAKNRRGRRAASNPTFPLGLTLIAVGTAGLAGSF